MKHSNILKQYWKTKNISISFYFKKELNTQLADYSVDYLCSRNELVFYNAIKSSEKKNEWLCGRYMLKMLLKDAYKSALSSKFNEIEIIGKHSYKPNIKVGTRKLFFDHSLSHSKDMFFGALLNNTDQLVDDTEIWVLSYYCASELAGALLMGRWARRVKDIELRSRMVWHCAEEARHAWKWVELIRILGANPISIPDSYQSNYFAEVGIPENEIEFLIITHIFEQRIARHFTSHKNKEGVHPLVKDLLSAMIEEEGPHLRWVRTLLNSLSKQDKKKEINKRLKYYKKIDEKAYKKEVEIFTKHGWSF